MTRATLRVAASAMVLGLMVLACSAAVCQLLSSQGPSEMQANRMQSSIRIMTRLGRNVSPVAAELQFKYLTSRLTFC